MKKEKKKGSEFNRNTSKICIFSDIKSNGRMNQRMIEKILKQREL